MPLPPGAFLQATAAGEAALASLVLEHCAEARTVADLFAGVGPFALRLAERVRVTAADDDAGAVAALRNAAAGARGLKPIARRAARPVPPPVHRRRARGIRRRGVRSAAAGRRSAGARARRFDRSRVVVVVSCNPATFTRDARILADGGYRLVRATPIDQFLYSAHVELVALFRKAKSE